MILKYRQKKLCYVLFARRKSYLSTARKISLLYFNKKRKSVLLTRKERISIEGTYKLFPSAKKERMMTFSTEEKISAMNI